MNLNYLGTIKLFIFVFLIKRNSSQRVNFTGPPWICVRPQVCSCYIKNHVGFLNFSTADALCKSFGGSLALFPSVYEHDIVHQFITMDARNNANREQEPVLFYLWIALKFDTIIYSTINDGMFWVTSSAAKYITPQKWKQSDKFALNTSLSMTRNSVGCVVVRVYSSGQNVYTDLVKVDCGGVANSGYLCEKMDPTFLGYRYYSHWGHWDEDLCQTPGKGVISRNRSCLTYECEQNGFSLEYHYLVCCDEPPQRIAYGNIMREYSWANGRGIENNTVQLRCDSGYVHPETRYSTTRFTCLQHENQPLGRWYPAIPEACVIVDCGKPPLGVHAYAPEYINTTFNAVATYFCQPGFKEPKYNRTSVTLRCGDSDTWIGLDGDPSTRANCEPVTDVKMEWVHYPPVTGGNDFCYRLNHISTDWSTAVDGCAGGLLYFENNEEFQFIVDQILEPQAERSVIWLAGRKDMAATEFTWRLEDDSSLPVVGYLKWAAYGPFLRTFHRDLCIAANYSDGQWMWVNVTCDNKFEYMCKTMQQKRHGAWSAWTEWGSCNRQYIRERTHTCNSPSPYCGGEFCNGTAIEYSHCCVDPGNAPYADIIYKPVSNDTMFLLPGHYFTYKCWFGYEHYDGSQIKNITCLQDGNWTDPGEAPKCQPKSCKPPGEGIHSSFTPSPSGRYVHANRVFYECEQGYGTQKVMRAGIAIQTNCSDGQWSDPPLICYAKVCANPHPQLTKAEFARRHINSKYVRIIDEVSHESWGWDDASNLTDLYRDKYQYFCEIGYKTPYKKVEYNITCLKNAQWSREALFETDSHPDECEPVECPGPPPQPKPNSVWSSGSNPNQANLRGKYKDIAVYSCMTGYQVDTGIQGDTRILLNYSFTCGPNNDWLDEYSPDSCIKQICDDPGHGINTEIRIGDDLWFGAEIDYVCIRGFAFNQTTKRRRLVCGVYDESSLVSWNGTRLNCSKIYCGDPGPGSKVTREGDCFEYNCFLVYSCIPQHVLAGGGTEKYWIRCTSQATWNGTAVSCEPAEMSSDFEIIYLRPFATQAQWIMSEKYKGVLCTFRILVKGQPGYMDSNGTAQVLLNYPSNQADYRELLVQSSDSGLLSMFIQTKAEYLYEFKLESESDISKEVWPSNVKPLTVYTSGGSPFLGSVQEQNLPNILPLSVLPAVRKRPSVVLVNSTYSAQVSFSKTMFSEQNGTIIGFAVIVKEVHPFHAAEAFLQSEGYHDPFAEVLFTYQEVQGLDKYTTWPAYFASPICNIFDPDAGCQKADGVKPSNTDMFKEDHMNKLTWVESFHSKIPKTSDVKVNFVIGLDTNCSANQSIVCNGPLRKNRIFCVKLRAYTRYGWNDTMCSEVIVLTKVLEFDHDLILPTILSGFPFVIFIIIGCYTHLKHTDEYVHEEMKYEDLEGDFIKSWSLHLSQSFEHHRRLKKLSSEGRHKMAEFS